MDNQVVELTENGNYHTNDHDNQVSKHSIDIFQRLNDDTIGYILSFLNIIDYLSAYDNLQGKVLIPIKDWSRSNMIFSNTNVLAIKSVNLKLYSTQIMSQFTGLFIYLTELDFMNRYHEESFQLAENLSQLSQLQRLTYHAGIIRPYIIEAIGMLDSN
jgi:hypothetical protein